MEIIVIPLKEQQEQILDNFYNINSTTGVLQINRLVAPSVRQQYQFTIAEEGSGTSTTAVVTLLPSGVTP